MRGITSILLSAAIFLAASVSSLSQSTAGPSSPNKPKDLEPDIKVSSRLVVVDVVVRKGSHPLSGLQQSDFTIDEDGAQQTIRYFAPHFGEGAPAANPPVTQPPSLPPDTYTNLPTANVTDSVTVLLLDGLNTQPSDVQYVRREMISYLKKMPSGRRIAVFALGHQLRLLQGFTTDSSLLLATLEKANATSPTSLLPPEDQTFQERAQLDSMRAGGVSPQDIANTQNFMSDADAGQTAMRVDMTLEAMQQLSRYLVAISGRKNLVWFSGSFPLQFFATYTDPYGNTTTVPGAAFNDDVKETADMLVAARVAVYPVDARGVLMQPMFSATQQTDYGTPSGGPARYNADRQMSGLRTVSEHSAEDVLAQQTGGRAVHDSNGLQDAIADALDDGSNYYTLAYIPTNTNYNGAQRNIQIHLAHEKADLYYRRSYYADATMLSGNSAKRDARAVFLESMQRGMPASSQIIFDVRVASPDQNPPSGPVVGTNSAMKNRAARYSIDYAAVLGTIGLTQSAPGTWQGHVAALAIAYDNDGNRVNWAVNDLPLNLDQASTDRAAHSGLQIHQVLDLPAGDVFLRVGIYDPTSGHFGTFEVPLHVAATR
jgi:VWFA-related protein